MTEPLPVFGPVVENRLIITKSYCRLALWCNPGCCPNLSLSVTLVNNRKVTEQHEHTIRDLQNHYGIDECWNAVIRITNK